MKNIVSWSGGKDSTTMLLMMIEKNIPIDDIIFVNTGLEFPEMIDYVKMIIKKFNLKVTILKPEHDWDYYFYSIRKKGNNIGKIYGFPCMIGAWCNDRLKMKCIEKYFKSIGEHIRFLGICKDEPNRIKRLESNERALLFEWGITEKDCKEYLIKRGLLNPLYNIFDRTGCWLCPKQSIKSLRVLFKHYPNLWDKLLEYDKVSPVPYKCNLKVIDLDKKFRSELNQRCLL